MQNQNALPEVGFVRLAQILAVVPISKSSWWAGVSDGRFPQPLKLGPRTTVWRVEDIKALIQNGVHI
jgi:prophage regulatory protein